jgi:putative toxin-antitoxin system antitoxin component (TIGR02293 family)
MIEKAENPGNSWNYLAVLGLVLDTTAIETVMQIISMTREGLPASVIGNLATHLGLTVSEFSGLLPVSERTIQRYSSEKQLSKGMSDHLLQIARIYTKSVEVFEDKEHAVNWLKTPCPALGNIRPLELLDTYSGIELVMNELNRIDYGVFA